MEVVWFVAKLIGACSVAGTLLFLVGAMKVAGRQSDWEREHFGEDH
jgi:hypothetical protein